MSFRLVLGLVWSQAASTFACKLKIWCQYLQKKSTNIWVYKLCFKIFVTEIDEYKSFKMFDCMAWQLWYLTQSSNSTKVKVMIDWCYLSLRYFTLVHYPEYFDKVIVHERNIFFNSRRMDFTYAYAYLKVVSLFMPNDQKLIIDRRRRKFQIVNKRKIPIVFTKWRHWLCALFSHLLDMFSFDNRQYSFTFPSGTQGS